MRNAALIAALAALMLSGCSYTVGQSQKAVVGTWAGGGIGAVVGAGIGGPPGAFGGALIGGALGNYAGETCTNDPKCPL